MKMNTTYNKTQGMQRKQRKYTALDFYEQEEIRDGDKP